MAVTLPAPELPPGPRSALVIATGAYANPHLHALRTPAQDARTVTSILSDPHLGNFTVTELLDRGVHDLRVAVDGFLANRHADETVLVYISCHGVLSARRRLYFSAADTDPDRLASTGLDAQWLIECLDECRAKRQVVVLDCCFSGAFSELRRAKGPADVGLEDLFGQAAESRGRVVLTASRATEYSFEGEMLGQDSEPGSIFTAALLEGLRTGAADANRDGFVSVSEAYAYAYRRVRHNGGAQTPQRWIYGAEGIDVIVSRSPAGVEIEPAILHDEVQAGINSRFPRVRLGAIETLAEWLTDPDPARVIAARAVLLEIAEQDIPVVAGVARRCLSQQPLSAVHELVPPGHLIRPLHDTGWDLFQQMELLPIRIEQSTNCPIVVLKTTQGSRYLTIWIAAVEAKAITFAQQGLTSLRPLTHDLFCDILDAVNFQLLSVRIMALRDGIFYGELFLSNGRILSARPSDGIALAIRAGAPILVSSELLAAIGTDEPEVPENPQEAVDVTDEADKRTASESEFPPDRDSRNVSVFKSDTASIVELELVGVRVEVPSNNPIVLLKERQGNRYLPIWTRGIEAVAVAFTQQGLVTPRPLTHDLLRDFLEITGVRLLSARITSLTDGIFYSDLILSNGKNVSAKPTDAIALAIRTGSPIEVAEEVLDEVGVEIPNESLFIFPNYRGDQ